MNIVDNISGFGNQAYVTHTITLIIGEDYITVKKDNVSETEDGLF
ncbi:MAG TPA: hypothetical protein VMF91_00275 [Bryobacteraceae bacterium]|nr:hypothetical protein [Bryobacteraceae bacterium]